MDITTTNVDVKSSEIEITGAVAPSVIESKHAAELNVPEYALVNAGLYQGSLTGNIPTWLDSAISNGVITGTVDLSTQISAINILIDGLTDGVNQNAVSILNEEIARNTLVTTVKSELEGSIAGAIDYTDTKVNDLETRVTDGTIIATRWLSGNETQADSYIIDNVTSYASENLASAADYQNLTAQLTVVEDSLTGTATNVSTGYATVGLNPDGTLNTGAGELGILTAAVGDLDVRLTTQEGVAAGYFHVWDGIETVQIGMIKFVDEVVPLSDGTTKTISVQYQYLGGTLGENNDGWVRTDEGATGWAGGASKLLADPTTGAVTGWSFGDGSNTQSQFKIQADKFEIQGSTTGYSPIAIDTTTGKLKFTGDVRFEGLGLDGGSTSINGGLLETNTVTADKLQTTELVISTTGGANAFAGRIRNDTNTMILDFVAGSIYIA